MRKHSLLLLSCLLAAGASAEDLGGGLFDGRSVPGASRLFESLSVAAPAAQAGKPISPDSSWTIADPDDANRDTNPSAPDKSRFWESLQNQVLDACRQIDLTVDQDQQTGAFAKVGGRLSRSLMRYPNGKLALLDEFTPRLSVGYAPTLFDGPDGLHGTISLGAQMSASSFVVRPLAADAKSCKELVRMANPLSFKTVLPMRPKRLNEMAVGELWKMSMAYQIGFQPALGASYQYVSVTLYWGKFHANTENVTLYRVSPDKLRLRVRLDRADIQNIGGAVVGSLTADELGLKVAEDLFAKQLGSTAAGFIDKALNRAIAHQINSYLKAVLDLSESTRTGRQSVLEFILDPGDQTQMTALADLLKGNLLSLKHLARMVKPVDLPEVVDERGRLEKWAGGDSKQLDKKETFAGSDTYKRKTKNLHFKLPILWDHQASWAKNEEDIVLLDSKGSRINVWQTEKRKSNKFFELPFLGHWTNHDKWRNAQTFTSRDKDGAALSPAVLYVHQEGFHHESAASARDMVRAADDIVRYAGVHGNGVNERTRLPVETLFPTPEPVYDPQRNEYRTQEPGYKGAVTALTMVFNQKAVSDILTASAAEVTKAFFNALDSSERSTMMTLLGANGTTVGSDGKISYDLGSQTRGMEREQEDRLRSTVSSLASTAGKIVRDLAEAAKAPTPEKQAQAFSRILSGSAKSGLAYEDILKVLVQLIDPMDLSAEFYMRTNKHVKGEKDVNVRYILNDRKISDDKLLGQMLEARKRFIDPTKLTD